MWSEAHMQYGVGQEGKRVARCVECQWVWCRNVVNLVRDQDVVKAVWCGEWQPCISFVSIPGLHQYIPLLKRKQSAAKHVLLPPRGLWTPKKERKLKCISWCVHVLNTVDSKWKKQNVYTKKTHILMNVYPIGSIYTHKRMRICPNRSKCMSWCVFHRFKIYARENAYLS